MARRFASPHLEEEDEDIDPSKYFENRLSWVDERKVRSLILGEYSIALDEFAVALGAFSLALDALFPLARPSLLSAYEF
eukprot:5878279-Pleurochrysis_carterae.AAC.1